MEKGIIVELIYHTALLVTLSVLYGLLTPSRKGNQITHKVLVGILFGLIVIAGMNMPVHYSEGIIYDGRSVILVLAGVFGGGIPTIIAIVISGIYRIYLGGAGLYAGLFAIVSCASVGLLFRHWFKNKPEEINLFTLWGIGFIAHIFMLLSQLLIPWPHAFEVINEIWFPILLVFPIATLIIGLLFRNEVKRIVVLNKISESELLFQTLSDNSPVGIFRTNKNGETTYVNARWCQLVGVTEEISKGDGWMNFIHPDDRERVVANWKLSFENDINSIDEYRFLRKNGEIIWVFGEAVPEFSEEGIVTGYIGTILDITERKESEKALAQSEENFRMSMDESPLGVRVVSVADDTLYANNAMLQIVGVSSVKELSDLSFVSLYTEESLQLNKIRREKRSLGQKVWTDYEIEIINLKGEEKYLQVFRKEIFWNGKLNTQLMYRDITERKRIERALVESANSLNEAERIARMGSWIYRISENKMSWSKNYYRIFEFDPFEIEPNFDTIRNKIHVDDRKLFDFDTICDEMNGDFIELEYRIKTSDGKYKWINDRVVSQCEDGKIVMLRGVVRDITELKEALTALQKSEQNYRNLFENHSAVKLMIDPVGGSILRANHAAAKFYGWTIEQLETMNIRQLNTINKKLVDGELLKSINAEGTHFEYEHCLSDGSVRNVEAFSSCVQFQGKDCLHIIIHDNTSKKIAENKLKLLSRSVEQNPISILITDPEGIIEYANPKFVEVTGYSIEELLGQNSRIIKSGAHSKEFYEELWKTILAGQEWGGEFQNKKKNGELYWESVIISPILDEWGKITNFIGLKEDVTGQKKMIREVVEAKDKAEESERLKSAFLANMSHEIRTPLNAILGFTQMLAFEEDLGKEQKEEFTSIINKSAESLLHIISDILDISQLETGMLKIIKQEFEVQDMLTDILAQCRLKMSDKQESTIELLLDTSSEPIRINTDHGRLIQIFMNLLNNSIKFTEQGYIRFGVFQHDEVRIGFFVSDTGIGMASEVQPSMFERFRQADDSTTRIYGGTGLGLSIVKSLVNLMGGEISLESELGKGTTFRFYLPVK